MQQQSKPEVLFVSHKSPPATGGMEKQSYELVNGVEQFLKVHRIIYNHKESLLTFFFLLNRRILVCLKNNPNIKIIHFNDGLIASLATFHKGYKHIKQTATLHGLDVVFPLPLFQKKILPRFNNFDCIYAVSDATAQAAIVRGLLPNKIQIITNGVDNKDNTKQTKTLADISHKYPGLQIDKKLLLTLGRPVKRKGFSWLLEHVIPYLKGDFQLVMLGPYNPSISSKERFLKLLPSKIRSILMLFIGYPSDEGALRKLLPLHKKKVIHLGKVPWEDLQIFLKESLAFLMPNIPIEGDMEGFGLVCLEASVAGSLVIASSLEGINSAIQQDKNGLLLPPLDKSAWINMLQNVLDTSDIYRKKAKAFTLYSKSEFSWDKMANSYVQSFVTICK